MNKKFLSAILFGAMLATSAGTFVSCKDYDDDIKGLQTQIDTNKTAIAELQKLVGAGNWVTSVAASGENLVVTMSNGTTATIAGIKGADGVDGKDAAEWTISEDGFWCKDGEKTTNVAVAQNGKDGKDGATAPSPTISDNGMWVVYSWDAAKGEFVAEETEIPAAGTSAYAVKANGIYTLYIADADGEMQEIALPATCDAIVVEAPYKEVEVRFEVSTWSKWTAAAKATETKDAAKALLAKYPAIADIKKDAAMKQGGMLPLIVTPAAVELTDEYSFSLQNVDGSIADIALSAPVKGADMSWSNNPFTDKLIARSASEACLWSLAMEPAYDKKKYSAPHYAATNKKASLVVENEKGTVVRTAFAYTVRPTVLDNEDVVAVLTNTATENKSKAPYAESIDLFASFEEDGQEVAAPVRFENDYKNHYIISVANALQAEMYGLSIAEDGHTLNIEKMPAGETVIAVKLSVVALGLNGSIVNEIVELEIGQEIAASEGITPAEVTLSKKDQIVTWDFEELGLTSAIVVDKFFGEVATNGSYENTITLAVTREADKLPAVEPDGDAEKYFAYNGGITFYNAKNKATAYAGEGEWTNGAPVKFGFTVDSDTKTTATLTGYTAEGWTEDVYTVTLKSVKGTSVIYAAQTELTVKNPELTTDYVKVVSAFVEDGVLQITGAPSDENVSYDLSNALTTANGATIIGFVDYDNKLYEGDSEEDYEFYNWVNPTEEETDNTYLIVNKWSYEPETFDAENPWFAACEQQLYQVRNIRAMVQLFNSDNVVPFDFQAIVKSEIYSEDASTITFDAAKLKGTFIDTDATSAVDTRLINVTKAITAKLAAGEKAGQTYNLFSTKDVTSTGSNTTYDYAAFETMGDYVKSTAGNVIEFSIENSFEIQRLFNALNNTNVNNDYTSDAVPAYKLKSAHWNIILTQISGYVNQYGKAAYLTDANGKVVTVKYRQYNKNEDGSFKSWVMDEATGLVKLTEAKVYKAFEAQYNNLKDMSGFVGPQHTPEIADQLKALTVIPEDNPTNGVNINAWIKIFNAYKESVKCKYTTEGTTSTTDGTPRNANIESVKVVFNNPAEAEKFFVITYAGANDTEKDAAKAKFMEDGIIFEAPDNSTSASYAGDFILTAKEAANVTVTTGKVVVDLKLIVEDKWGMIMEIPFNVEVSVVKK